MLIKRSGTCLYANLFAVTFRIIFAFILSGLAFSTVLAQNIPIGAWRTHAAYQSVQTVAIAQNKIYAGSPGSFFFYDKEIQQIVALSKLDGFSSSDISKLAYDPQTQTLVIAYVDGGIDLLQETNLFTIRSITSSTSISTSKKNNHILLQNGLAYLAYDFGVVVLDLKQHQIKETYQNLGVNGAVLAVYGTATLNGQIYLATANGVLTAPLTGVNLLDFANWYTIPAKEGIPIGSASKLSSFGDKLYVSFNSNGIFQLVTNQWTKTPDLPLEQPLFLKVSQQKLLIGYSQKLLVLDGQTATTITHALLQSPQEAEYATDGKLWIADASTGLVSNEKGDFLVYAPNGTVKNVFQRLTRWQNNVVALPGGYTSSYSPKLDASGFSVFTNNGWQNHTITATESELTIPAISDLITTVYNPVNQTYYVASFGDGILVKRPTNSWQLLNETGAPPSSAKITGLTLDLEGTIWIGVYGAPLGEASLYSRTGEGVWQRYFFNTSSARQPISLLIDDYHYLWMALASGGIWVFDPVANRGKLLSTTTGQGGLPSANVYSIAKDSLGQIWAGTGRGAAYFFNPGEVFDSQSFDAITPIFEGRQILRDEVVTSIRIDGGNRKWFGTQNGAWLFDADITNQLAHFTASTTPLISDYILDLEIQPATGEIFFSTDAGLISFRGTATEATAIHNNVKVFPNPVRPGFNGTVGISGLASNSIVKITDIAGRLVYQTRANGGTAVWNVQDYRARRVSPGMYLIFSSSDDGVEKFVTKIAVIE